MRCGCVVLAAAGSIAMAGVPAPDAAFRFDGSAQTTGGLGFTLERSAPTVLMDGTPVAPGQPRFAPVQHLPTPPRFEVARATTNFTAFFGSGYDHDGVTPMKVVFEQPAGQNGFIDVYRGDAASVPTATPGNGITRTMLGTNNDIFQGTSDFAWAPRSGVICHGLIVLQCEVLRFRIPPGLPGVWEEFASGYVYSQDGGATWTILYRDTLTDVGIKRARDWSFQNWFPLENTQGAPPLLAWFTGADYRSINNATGGFMHLFRATRPAVGAPWQVEPVFVPFSLNSEGNKRRHMHSAGLLRYGESGLRFVGANGDNRDDNFIVSVIRDDENYRDAPGWTRQEQYHGSRDPNGTYGNQFVGCAPTDDPRRLLLGTDLSMEQIMSLDCPDDAPHPTTGWLFGRNTANHRAGLNFVLRTPTPERAGPYCVEWSVNPSLATPVNASRALYSPDGAAWALAADPRRSVNFPLISDGFMYLSTRSGDSGVLRTPLPELVSRRPLAVGPGGVQHATDAPAVLPAGNGSITPLTRNADGLWEDAGVVLDPQPPALGPVYRVTMSGSLTSPVIADLRLGGAGDIGAVSNDGLLRVRTWLLSASPDQSVILVARYRATGASSFARSTETNVNTVRDWWPIDLTTGINPAPGQALEIRLESASPAPTAPSFYLAIDTVAEGAGWPGYPMPADTTGAGTLYPDERAAITGLSCGSAWTVTLAGMVPDDAWDSSVTTAGTRWPIATVWGDADNFVEFVADTASGRLLAEVTSGGQAGVTLEGPPVYWLRNSPVLISVSQDASGVAASCSVSAQEVFEMTPAALSGPNLALATPPGEIRFGDASGLSGDSQAVRVSPMWWFGGAVHRSTALTDAQRRALLESLSFLDGAPVCPADVTTTGSANGVADGIVDVSDYSFFLTLWAAGDPRADVTTTGSAGGVPDGTVDVSDFSYYLSLWAAGCP